MTAPGIKFPSAAEVAVRNADELHGLTAAERLERLLALVRSVDRLPVDPALRSRQVLELERQKGAELRALAKVQGARHV